MNKRTDRFEQALRLVNVKVSELTEVEVNEYFEYADLALSLRTKSAGVLKQAAIQYLEMGDINDNNRYGTVAKLISVNLDRFGCKEIEKILRICRSQVRSASEPRPIHFLSDILNRLNESLDWKETT